MSGHVAMLVTGGRDPRADAGAGAGARTITRTAPVLILAGGTGGHIFPGIAVAQELRGRGVPVLWIGSAGGLETTLVPDAGFELRTLAVRGVRGKALGARLAAPWHVARAVWNALRLVGDAAPRSALALGGFASGPAGIAAWLRGVPLLVHEQNSVPGVTNRILAKFAKKSLCGFSGALASGEWLGNPVRAAIAALAPPDQRYAGRGDALRVLVLGGSQGARSLNLQLPEVFAQWRGAPLQIRHQAGAKHVDEARRVYRDAGVDAQVDPFIADMAAAYAWADLVVCRAGALTVAELCAAGLPALFVPFPAAVDDHQTRNAATLVDAGAARLVAEGDGFTQRLGAALDNLCAGSGAEARTRLLGMARAARTLAKPDAAARIADRCLEAAR